MEPMREMKIPIKETQAELEKNKKQLRSYTYKTIAALIVATAAAFFGEQYLNKQKIIETCTTLSNGENLGRLDYEPRLAPSTQEIIETCAAEADIAVTQVEIRESLFNSMKSAIAGDIKIPLALLDQAGLLLSKEDDVIQFDNSTAGGK